MSPAKDPEATRSLLIDVAAEEFCRNGYQATSLTDILEKSGVSKGGLYHHFSSKKELCYAVFDEIYTAEFHSKWSFADDLDDPLKALCRRFREIAEWITEEVLELGCPVTNMALELASSDEAFGRKFGQVYDTLTERFRKMLQEAKQKGLVAESTDPMAVATFVVAAILGMKLQGRCVRNIGVFKSSILAIADYLESLRA